MDLIKQKLKKNKFIKLIYEMLFQRPIYNFFGADHSKKVLFSYSTYHFNKRKYNKHSNYRESKKIAEIFDRLGYRVDIINNDREHAGSLKDYDVIFGEGIPMYQAIDNKIAATTICYATGSHPWQCTNASLSRVVEFYNTYQVSALSSARIKDHRWGLAASMSDAVICIGNEVTKGTFTRNGSKTVLRLDPTFIERADSTSILKERNMTKAKQQALWFGSYGLLHKGLDIAIEAFRGRPDWSLHVCGYTDAEATLLSSIKIPENVHIHGFIDVLSDSFKEIAIKCGFVILPSCSEGTATAVLTAVGSGAMIPIVTAECGVDIDCFGFNIELSKMSVIETLIKIESMSVSQLNHMAIQANDAVRKRYSFANFEKNIESHLIELLANRKTKCGAVEKEL